MNKKSNEVAVVFHRRIVSIFVHELFGELTYHIPLNSDERTTIVYGPNGIGKTTLLRMVTALFNSNLAYLIKTPFSGLTVNFTDNSKIHVKNIENNKKPAIEISLNTDKSSESFKFDAEAVLNRESRVVSNYLDEFLPTIRRTGPDTWMDRSTGRMLTTEQIISDYGEFIPDNILSKSLRIPEWLKDFNNSVDVRLIETQRLSSISEYNPSRDRYPGQVRTTNSMVAKFAEDLAQSINSTLSKYAELSQSLDSTFPNRLLKRDTDQLMSRDSIIESLNNLQEKRNSIMSLGILPKEDNELMFFESRDIIGSENVLSLYVKDVEDKLGLFDEILEKMQTMSSIINTKFTRKFLTYDAKKGFMFKLSKRNQILPYDKLSSGEQHEIVMLYELLFKTSPNTLIMIDEPEISLHIVWQQRFLSDLRKVTTLVPLDILIMTHSPQIIHDRWDLTYDIAEDLEGA